MFILSPGNYRKCSTHVHCIIVFAVVIGKAWAGRKESEVLETLVFSGATTVWTMKVFIRELILA